MSRTPVGEIRPSQLLWTYGPGALIDLPNMSVVTMGIDRWDEQRWQMLENQIETIPSPKAPAPAGQPGRPSPQQSTPRPSGWMGPRRGKWF